MSRSPMIPSLNGVRTLAVLLVAAGHVGWGNIVPGGLGVTVFFFLSGYLISTLLRLEFLASDSIDLKNFYFRRFIRLSPPLVITLSIAMILTAAGWTTGGVTLQGTLAQLFYFANYYGLFWHAEPNIPGGTVILWSLAVEEHFYIIYPVLLLAMLRLAGGKSTLIMITLLCVVVLAWRMFLVSEPGDHTDRIYYATDTRFDSLLWGCVLGMFPTLLERYAKANTNLLLAVGLALILMSVVVRNEYFRNTFRYTLQGVALIPIFMSLLLRKSGLIFRFLNHKWMHKGGDYSYSFYLIHAVVINLMSKTLGLDQRPALMFVIVVVLSFTYASVLYTLVERPLKSWRQRLQSQQPLLTAMPELR